jgi:peptide/nickel transport system substrate-binding protein
MERIDLGTLSRRRFLELTLAGAATVGVGSALAACSGSSSTTGAEYHGWWPFETPPTGHFNSFVANAITLGIYEDTMEMAMAMYRWKEQRYMPLLATGWRLDPPATFTVDLRQGVKWSDGSSFTAQDVVTTFTIQRMQKTQVWTYVDKVEARGAHTVVFTMSNPSTMVPYLVLRTAIRAHSVYGQWAARAQRLFDRGEAPSGTAFAALVKDFNGFRPRSLVVTGPYTVDTTSITTSQLTLKKVGTSWLAGKVNFDRIVLYNEVNPSTIPELVLAKKIDYATSGFTPAVEKEMIAKGLRIIRPPTFFGPALYFNYATVKAAADPRVRQAIATAVDRKANGAVALSSSGTPSKYMAGVSDSLVEQWLSPADVQQLNRYEYNQSRAASLLQDAGWRRSGGAWTTPDGSPFTIDVTEGAEQEDWLSAANNLADQLTEFGIKSAVRTVPGVNVAGMVNTGSFTAAIEGWGSGSPHPYFSFYADLITYNTGTAGKGMSYPLVQQTQSVGQVDLRQLIDQSAAGLDRSAQQPVVTKLAKAFNELLPIIPLWERLGNDPVLEGSRVTGWPGNGDRLYQNSVYADNYAIMLLLDGTLRPAKT